LKLKGNAQPYAASTKALHLGGLTLKVSQL